MSDGAESTATCLADIVAAEMGTRVEWADIAVQSVDGMECVTATKEANGRRVTVLPLWAHEGVTLERLRQGCAVGASMGRRVVFAVCDADSTVCYYQASDGIPTAKDLRESTTRPPRLKDDGAGADAGGGGAAEPDATS